MPFRLPPGPAAGGASRPLLEPFTGVAASTGVSADVDSPRWAGVSGVDDDDGGLDASDDFDGGS